jgi:NAD(P)-dependent dehydrogenase (short-subunit alcohol dehydrogenase family)
MVVLINNAGVFPRVPFLEMTEHDWDHVLDVNLKGSCFCGSLSWLLFWRRLRASQSTVKPSLRAGVRLDPSIIELTLMPISRRSTS